MERPSKYTQQRINQCLDELIELGKDSVNTELPKEMRQRGANILNNIFKPDEIDAVSIKNLTEQLKLIRELRNEESGLEAARIKRQSSGARGWINKIVNLFNKKSPATTSAKNKKPFKQGGNKNPGPSPNRSYPTYEPKVYGRSGKESYAKIQHNNNNRNPPPNHTKIEHFSNDEMRSRQDEKRLDGSPDPYAYRDHGLYGSHPLHDDYTDESQA